MADPRITRDAVLEAINSPKNRRRIRWTASTTLPTMGIEFYPNFSKANYRRMNVVLKGLLSEGFLAARPAMQSNYTYKEVAYERSNYRP